jgi:hypothetical protein
VLENKIGNSKSEKTKTTIYENRIKNLELLVDEIKEKLKL